MSVRRYSCAALALAAVALTPAANAATVSFTGTRMNTDSPGAQSARCGARFTANIRVSPNSTSVGASNFGAFTPTLSHCIALPPATMTQTPFDLGEFLFEFASGATLFGTYSGALTPTGPGMFNIAQTHVVTGGTGTFLGATGMFDSMGTLSFPMGVATVNQSFAGTLDAPAIPEPATWGMMILGFAGIGTALRRRQRLAPALG